MSSSITELHNKGIKYRGGFRGKRVAVADLIDRGIMFDLVDFRTDESRVRDCESYCIMQIAIGGLPYVVWHSSAILTEFLQDARELSADNFPIIGCMLYEGEDRGYYLKDADSTAVVPSEREMERICENKKRR